MSPDWTVILGWGTFWIPAARIPSRPRARPTRSSRRRGNYRPTVVEKLRLPYPLPLPRSRFLSFERKYSLGRWTWARSLARTSLNSTSLAEFSSCCGKQLSWEISTCRKIVKLGTRVGEAFRPKVEILQDVGADRLVEFAGITSAEILQPHFPRTAPRLILRGVKVHRRKIRLDELRHDVNNA